MTFNTFKILKFRIKSKKKFSFYLSLILTKDNMRMRKSLESILWYKKHYTDNSRKINKYLYLTRVRKNKKTKAPVNNRGRTSYFPRIQNIE